MDNRRIRYGTLLFYAISIFLHLTSAAQIKSWKHTHYTTKDGLPSNNVHHVVQDHEGYIWIATESGLCKFDGDEFNWVLHNQKDSNSVPADYIYDVAIHPDGRLLASTANGLYVMNTKTNKGFTIHSQITKGWESMDDNLRNISINIKLQRIFVLTATAIIVFDFDLRKVKTIAYSFPDATENIGLSITNYSPLFLPNGDVLFADNHTQKWGLMDYSQGKIVSFQTLKNHPYQEITQSTQMDCFSLDSAGNIWFHIVGKDTLYCLKPHQRTIAYPLLGDAKRVGWTGRICFPNAQKMTWAYIDKASTILYELPYREMINHPGCSIQVSNPSGFSATTNAVYGDRAGNWWVSSINGLHLVKSDREAFEKIELPLPYKFESEWQYVTDIKRVDDDHLLITTLLEHCYLYNTQTNTMKSYLDTVGFEKAGEYVMHFVIPLDGQRNLIYGDQGFMFENQRLSLHPKLENKFEKLFDQYAVRRFYKDSKGNSWVSFEGYGLVLWEPKSNKLTRFEPNGELCTDQFTSIAEDGEGNLWFLNYVQTKLWKFNRQKFAFDSNYIQLPYRWNQRLVSGNNHHLYMASSEGLVIFNTQNHRSRLMNMFDGLPSSSMLGLYNYRNYLFISTKNGLAIMNTNDYTIQVVNQSEGIFEGLTTKAFFEDTIRRKLYIGGKGHVYKLDLNSFFISRGKPVVAINQVNVNNLPFNAFDKPFTLNSNENSISFSVSSIDFYSHSNRNYYYRMIYNGDTSKWNNNDQNKRFSLLNLSPGEYTIEVKSTNAFNEWSRNTAFLSFRILKPWYNHWIFYAFIAVSLMIGIYFIFLYRIRQIKRIERIRNKLSRDLHDDIGSTLSSINILSKTAKRQAELNGNEQAKLAMEKINERSQRLLSNLHDIIWNINPNNDSTEDMLSRMREYASTLLDAKGIDYIIDFPKEDLVKLPLDIKSNLYLIFKEAINNISKYASCTLVKISFTHEQKMFRLIIEDNGIGFDKSLVKSNGGLNNMQQRANEMKAIISIQSDIGKGTVVKLIWK